jgi:ribosome-associated heat shock protein Hsp15
MMDTAERAGPRLDKWLWTARFFKTRSLASKLISSGRLRLNGTIMSKPHRQAQLDMVLTFPQGDHIRVIRIAGFSERRGPAVDAVQLYEDLAPPEPASQHRKDEIKTGSMREPGTGRPTKKERRAIDRLMR